MVSRDSIHDAQDQVASLQGRLDDVQSLLEKADQVVAAGEAARERAQQTLLVATALVGVGVVLLVWGGRKKSTS